MDIAFAFDERYASRVSVAVESLLRAADKQSNHRIWIVTTAECLREIEDDLRIQVGQRATVSLVTAGEKFTRLGLSRMASLAHVGPGAHIRLFLPDLLPDTVGRFLYLDTDVLIEGDLELLASINMRGSVVAAIQDRFTQTFGAQGGVPGSSPRATHDSPYFNSGVLLVDKHAWRRAVVTERCVEYLEANRSRLRFPDQDALNLACEGAWLALDERWNYQGWWPDPGEPEDRPDDIRITHYVGRRKPWDENFPLTFHRNRWLRMAERAASHARSGALET